MPVEPANTAAFRPAKRTDAVSFADRAALAEFDAAADTVCVLGAGDHLSVRVLGRPEMSARRVVGPDGRISMPLIGTLRVAELAREEATVNVQSALLRCFKRPEVALSAEQYPANRVTVLGRAQNPGVLNFDKVPTILEVLARAGGLPVLDKQAMLRWCANFRGRDTVIWIDLKHLLARGDPVCNVRLKPNDIVYIPDSGDTSVYVMGAVPRPGAYRLTPDMSLLDALARGRRPERGRVGAGSRHLPRGQAGAAEVAAHRRPPRRLRPRGGRHRPRAEEHDGRGRPRAAPAGAGARRPQLRVCLPGLRPCAAAGA